MGITRFAVLWGSGGVLQGFVAQEQQGHGLLRFARNDRKGAMTAFLRHCEGAARGSRWL